MKNTQQNKHSVLRFNHEFLAQGDLTAFYELVAPDFINHTAAPNVSKGPDGMIAFIQAFHAGFSDLRVEILHQLAENDLVATRKVIHMRHTGTFMGIAPSGKAVTLPVMDLVRLEKGQYKEHWGMRDMQGLVEQLKA